MPEITIRPSIKSDGEAILSIMDANVLWFRTIGSTQWGPELFSDDATMVTYWKDRAGTGEVLGDGKAQIFVVEVDDWEDGASGRRVGGFYMIGKRWPKYVPDVDEPSVFIGNTAIHPKLRGKGIGAAMIADAKTIASKVGAAFIRLDTYGGTLGTTTEGAKLIDAWVKLGFERVAQVSPSGGPKTDTEPWQQILALRV